MEDVIVMRTGLCRTQVCASKLLHDAELEDRTNELNPTGINSRWQIRRHLEPIYAQCESCADRHHVIMEC
jgi:hypothetical protein